MHFDDPQAFLLLLLLLPLLWLLRRSAQRSDRTAALFHVQAPGAAYFRSRAALAVLFLAAVTAVAAGPRVTYGETADIVFLTDVSRSMQARHSCAEPTFLGRAKRVMRATMLAVPEARYAIFSFERFAFPLTQLTNDLAWLDEVIEHGLYVGLTLEATQTEIANALAVVAQKKQRLPDIYGRVSRVVLLSDGHVGGNFRRRLQRPIEALRAAGLRVSAVGIGNPQATPIIAMDGERCESEFITVDGERVMIPLRRDILSYIAAETSGNYYAETETARLARDLRSELKSAAADEAEAAVRHRDASAPFLGAATLALVGYFGIGLVARRRRAHGSVPARASR